MKSLKCELCGKRIGTTILGKLNGTYIKDKRGRLHLICSECQRKFQTKDAILKALKLE